MTIFFRSYASEWLKKKRSAADFLVISGGFFIPFIVLLARFNDFRSLPAANANPQLWMLLLGRCWQLMALFFLPMGVILATSLVTQLEFKNNTWKQLHTTPQWLTNIYFTKLAVILTMMLQFLLLFNIGIYFTGVIPSVFKGVPYPVQPFPFRYMLITSAAYFTCSLPVIAFQYLVSLLSKNFLIPIGVGLALHVAAMFALNWQYSYAVPYSYSALNFFAIKNNSPTTFKWWAAGYFIVFIAAGYILYITKKEKG